MPRAKGGPKTRRRHKKTMKQAKGYVGGRRKTYRQARETVERGLTYAYRDRKTRKREARALWIVRINAAAREHGLSYSRLCAGLRAAGEEVDRKILAALALDDPRAFAEVAGLARTRAPAAAAGA
jgi:large subunit ribosomal protein L20